MSKIPTVEEFLDSKLSKNGNVVSVEITKKMMIEFAKLHVQAALEKACDTEIISDIDYESGNEHFYQNTEGILNCYPLENIK